MLQCSQCSYVTAKRYNLIRHLNTHETIIHENWKCGHCLYTTNSKYSLKRHIFTTHSTTNEGKRNNQIVCPICGFKCNRRNTLIKHCSRIHQETVEEEKFVFASVSEFQDWKKTVERESRCRYVSKGGMKKLKNGGIVNVFYCHRDGFFKSKGSGKKLLKSQGSNKIGGCCLSHMQYRETNGEVCVQYVKTHFGHEENIGRLNLSKDERAAIAEKIEAGVPFDVILDYIRDQVSDIGSELALITKQDLRNIARDFNLNTTRFYSKRHVKSTRDCFYDRLRKLVKKERSRRTRNILRNHCKAAEVEVSATDVLNTWLAQSMKNSDVYEVKLVCNEVKICGDNNCVAVCENCEPRICVHTFSCQCRGYSVKRNDICEHIHSCVSFILKYSPETLTTTTEHEIFNDDDAASPLPVVTSDSEQKYDPEQNDKRDDDTDINSLITFFNTTNPVVVTDDNLEIRRKLELLSCYFTPHRRYSDESRGETMRTIDELLNRVRSETCGQNDKMNVEPTNRRKRSSTKRKPEKRNKVTLSEHTGMETSNLTQSERNLDTSEENLPINYDYVYVFNEICETETSKLQSYG